MPFLFKGTNIPICHSTDNRLVFHKTLNRLVNYNSPRESGDFSILDWVRSTCWGMFQLPLQTPPQWHTHLLPIVTRLSWRQTWWLDWSWYLIDSRYAQQYLESTIPTLQQYKQHLVASLLLVWVRIDWFFQKLHEANSSSLFVASLNSSHARGFASATTAAAVFQRKCHSWYVSIPASFQTKLPCRWKWRFDICESLYCNAEWKYEHLYNLLNTPGKVFLCLPKKYIHPQQVSELQSTTWNWWDFAKRYVLDRNFNSEHKLGHFLRYTMPRNLDLLSNISFNVLYYRATLPC